MSPDLSDPSPTLKNHISPYHIACKHIPQDSLLLTMDCVPRVDDVVTGVIVMVLVTLLAPGLEDMLFLGERRTVPVITSFSAATFMGLTVITGLAPS